MASLASSMALLSACAFAAADDVDRLGWVSEAAGYALVYGLDLQHLGRTIVYDQDRSAEVTKPFDRIAYFLELQASESMVMYVWVSMDAFTTDPRRIGIPTGWAFWQKVTGMRVVSNSSAVTAGEVGGGRIEFGPSNYTSRNGDGVPGASDGTYDFGDTPASPDTSLGYGSMQVHNPAARQTIFAVNDWRAGSTSDLGIGNSPDGHPDWTFSRNAATYQTRRLRVFVHPASMTPAVAR